jgi:hypothetical protein
MSERVTREALRGDEIAIIDSDEEKSVYNLVPASIQKALDSIPPAVWEMSFSDLSRKAKPSVELKKLRLSFWLEYERAVRNGNDINFNNVSKGIMNPKHFMETLGSDFYRCAYIMTPPEDYRVNLEEMLTLALEEERKILEQPLINKQVYISKKGEIIEKEVFDTKLGDLKHKIRESLYTRIFGAPVQRTLSRNINQNYNEGESPSNPSHKDLEAEIERLKAQRDAKFIEVGGIKDDVEGGAKEGNWQSDEEQS